MMRNLGIVGASWALAFGCAGLAVAAEEKEAARPAAADEEATFELRKVSVLKITGDPYVLLRGQRVECGAERDREVKAYPKLKSKHPFFGKVKFDATWASPKTGTEYHFVIDESGEKPTEARAVQSQSGEDKLVGRKSGKTGSLPNALATSASGDAASTTSPRLIVKPSKIPITYDRLYFDANRDLDLTNDPILLPMKDPPSGTDPYGSRAKQVVTYDHVAIPFDYGPGLGTRNFRVMPRLMIDENEGKQHAFLFFVATEARQGRICVGSRQYDALLAQSYLITGRFDQPATAMLLTCVSDPRFVESWWGSEYLAAMRRVEGKYYTTSATPVGDKLTVKPYRGELGLFKLGPAKRDLKELSMTGSLHSENSAVAVGDPGGGGEPAPTTQYGVPVGDYTPGYMTIEYGRVRIELSSNGHSDGRPRDIEKKRVYAIQIRKDKPFVLDFSNKPEVVFASPAKDQTFKRGEALRVAAVLTDPRLDIMIRRFHDTSRKQKEVYKFPDGKELSYQRLLSLDPKVTITNSSGKQVAEGKLPFG